MQGLRKPAKNWEYREVWLSGCLKMISTKKPLDEDPQSDFFNRYYNFSSDDKMSEFEEK